MSIKIGTISISLTAETASFQTEMGKASQIALTSSRAIEKSFTLMGTAIVAATGAAIGALGLLVERTQDVVFAMQKQAQQAGVSIEAFSKLAYAAKVAGMDQEQMAVIMTRISKSSFEAASGNKKSAEAYKNLGISVSDMSGHFKTADQLILEVAKKLDTFADSNNRTGVETTIMGRSGAMAASFMHVLATRFDEVSETAKKLGVVFTQETAASAQKLHDSILMVEEAGLGLSVRLLSKVSPALDQLADKIVSFVSNADNMKKIDHIGEELAQGIHIAGEALEFLINHFDTLKTMVEALVAIRLGGMFIPMIASAAGAEGTIGKLGIALANMGGSLLGIRKMGTIFAPMIADTVGYTAALGSLVKEEGLTASTTSLLAAELKSLGAFLGATVLPAALAAGAVMEFALAVKSAHEYSDVKAETGASWWQIQKAEIDEATQSLGDFVGWLEMVSVGKGEEGFYSRVAQRVGAKDPMLKAPKAPGLPEGYDTDPTMGGVKKKDMPALNMGEDKFAGLTKRLEELKARAEAATRALNLVGASPQELQDSKILEEYNLFLAAEKKLLDQLPTAKRAAAEASAHESITTLINAQAAEKYEKALYDLSVSLRTSSQEHEAMAAAVGKSAQAMQDAMVKAKVAQEMQKAYGNGWEKDPKKLLDAEMSASQIRDEMNKANVLDDAKSLYSTQLQIAAQERLNAAILEGADAREAAALANDKEALKADFKARGDTDDAALKAQLDLLDKKADAERTAGDLQRAANMDPALKYQEQTKAIHDAAAAAEKYGVSIDYRQVLEADKQAWLQFVEAEDKAALATGDIADGLRVAFEQMARDTESMAQRMYDAVNQAVNAMNDALSKIITEKHKRGDHMVSNTFASAFRSVGSSLSKQGLQLGESALMKALGFGNKTGKPDGTKSNPWYVTIAGNGAKNYVNSKTGKNELDSLADSLNSNSDSGGGTSNALTKLFGALTGGGTSSSGPGSQGSGTGGIVTSIVGTLLKFIPGFAEGTDAMVPDMPAIVGEKGPELFIPPSAGAIVPNSKLGGSLGTTHVWNIDARNSTDPAQTAAMVRQGIAEAAPQIMAATLKAQHEKNVRVAPRART